MPRSRALLLVFALLLFCSNLLALAQNKPAPGASKLISGSPEQLLQACRADLEKARADRGKLVAMKAPRDPAATLDAFEAAALRAIDAASRASLAQQVLPAKEGRDAAQVCEQEASKFLTGLLLDRPVYNVLSSLDTGRLDAAGKYILSADLRDYRRNGVDKDEATRAKVRQLNEELVKISQEFNRNISDDIRRIEFDAADLDGLPADYKQNHAPGANGKISLTTNNTDFFPFMVYANSGKAREAFYRLYFQVAYPSNMDVLARMLQKRYELAKLLGYSTWADYILQTRMAGSKQNVADFIDKISKAAEARSRADSDELLAAKKRLEPSATVLNAWDVALRGGGYLQNKVKSDKFAFDAGKARPYFEYSRVKQALLDLTSKMYGVSYRPVRDAVVWHNEVEVYDVYEGNSLLGRIYFDLFPRENKFTHYATFTLAVGKKGVEAPEAVLVCNFPRPGKEPALMEYNDVVTFFHEYGHLLDAIFSGQNRWLGADQQFDFVEVASQILEEWARDPAVLQSFAKHYQTNEPIPAEMVQKLRRANEFGKGLEVRRQMVLAAISLHYYDRNPAGLDTTRMAAEIWNQYVPYKYVDGTYFQTRFGHLDGYSAGYYTYMWSLVIAKDAFSVFREKGLLNPEVAGRFRHSVLDVRGTRPAADQVKEFLGRPYSFKAYEQWLNAE